MPEAPPAQPPEALRIAAYRAARSWAAEHGHPQPDDRMLNAALAALFDACEVEEEWMVTVEGNGGSIILPTYLSRAKAVNVARSYGGAATVRRRLTLTWTDEPTLRVTAGAVDQQTRT